MQPGGTKKEKKCFVKQINIGEEHLLTCHVDTREILFNSTQTQITITTLAVQVFLRTKQPESS